MQPRYSDSERDGIVKKSQGYRISVSEEAHEILTLVKEQSKGVYHCAGNVATQIIYDWWEARKKQFAAGAAGSSKTPSSHPNGQAEGISNSTPVKRTGPVPANNVSLKR